MNPMHIHSSVLLMKTYIITALLAAGSTAIGLESGGHYVVKITQLTGELEFATMDKEELKNAEKQYNLERRYYTSALRDAKTKWSKTAGTRGRPFPKGLSRRKISVLGSPGTSTEALNKLGEHLDAQAEQAKEDRKRMIKKVEDRYPIYHNMSHHDMREAKELRRERINHLDALEAENRNDRQTAAGLIQEVLSAKTGGHNSKPKEVQWTIGKSFSSEGSSSSTGTKPATTPTTKPEPEKKPGGAGVVEP